MKPTAPPGEAAVFQQEQAAIRQARAALADPALQQTPWAAPFAHLLQSYEKLWTHTQRMMRMSDRFQEQLQAAKQAEARAEEGLAEALSRLQLIARQVPGVIFQYRLHSNGSACFPYASDYLYELFRVSPAEARQTATTVWAKLHRHDAEGTLASIRDSARDLTPWCHEFRVLPADAPMRCLLGNALPQREADGSTLWHGFITDITERQQAEEALRKSEAKFKDMVDTLPLAILLTTGTKQITNYVNPTMVRLFGYTRGELPSMKEWWPLACPDATYCQQIAAEWNRRVWRAIDTQSPTEPMEVVVTCKDGSRKNILWGYIPLGDKNYAYGLDLTARKQAEAALGAERWRLQHLFEHSPVATWLEDFTVLHQWMEQLRAQGVTDLSAFLRERPAQVAHALGLIRVLDMNLAAVVQNAAQSKQHLRESLPQLFNERTYADFAAELAALWQGQFNFEYESHGRRLDGRLLVALVRLDVPLQDGQPDFSQVIVTGTDITERKQAELAVRLSEQQLHAYLDNAGDAIYVLDISTGRIRSCNARASHDLGYRPDELLNLSATDIETVLSAETVASLHQQLKSGEAITIEGTHRRKDGTTFPVEIRLSSLAPAQPELLISMVRDISKRKQAEEELHQAKAQTQELLARAELSAALVRDLVDRQLQFAQAQPVATPEQPAGTSPTS